MERRSSSQLPKRLSLNVFESITFCIQDKSLLLVMKQCQCLQFDNVIIR